MLKRKLQPELDKAWVTKTAANHSKPVGRIVPSCRIKTSAGEAELGAVEQIEELCSELYVSAFGNAGPLEDGKIKVVDSVRAQRGIHSRLITKTPLRRWCEAGRIEPACKRSAAAFRATGYDTGAYIAYAKVGVLQRSGGTAP